MAKVMTAEVWFVTIGIWDTPKSLHYNRNIPLHTRYWGSIWPIVNTLHKHKPQT